MLVDNTMILTGGWNQDSSLLWPDYTLSSDVAEPTGGPVVSDGWYRVNRKVKDFTPLDHSPTVLTILDFAVQR